jgi:hypothetical protein
MSEINLNVFQYSHNLSHRVSVLRQFPDKPVLSDNRSIGDYVEALFGDLSRDDIYVRNNKRPMEGFGAHFDIYNDGEDQLLHEDYPFVATYNTWGSVILRATVLSDALRQDYDANFPEQTREAYAARRSLGNYALNNPNAEIFTHQGVLRERSGIVIPQVPGGPYVVHEVSVPSWIQRYAEEDELGGECLKFSAPADTKEAREELQSIGYVTFADFEPEIERLRLQREASQQERSTVAWQKHEQREQATGFLNQFGIDIEMKYD